MSQIKKKYIADKAIDGSKILLMNNESLKALNASGVEQEILKFSSADSLIFSVLPEFSSDPTNGNQLTRKSYVDGQVSAEESRAMSAESALDGRLDIIEGSESQAGSIAKALKDAKDYTDSEVAQEVSDRQAAVSAEETRAMNAESELDGRLDIIEGPDSQAGSIAKSLKDAKAYADQKIQDLVNGAPQVLDTLKELSDALGGDQNFAATIASQLSGLDGRLDTVEGDENTSGSIAKALKDAKAYADQVSGNSGSQVQGNLDQEILDRIAGDNALDSRLDVIEGADNVEGSVAKAEKDAKDFAQSLVDSEQSARESADNALDSRLDVIEGPDSQAGSIAKALKDAKSYTDAEVAKEVEDRQDAVSAEETARISADNALDARLDVIEGPDTQAGSVAKALKDAKDYTDAEVETEAEAREASDNSLDNRLIIIEDETGTVEGSMSKYFEDGKDYTDTQVAAEQSARESAISAEQSARESADNALDGRLDVLEGADNVSGSVAKSLKDAKAYADQKISDLINGAPQVLDTLKELSDALGGDENFAVTIAGQISGLDSRLDVIEGDENTSGSIAKSLKDAKAYTDQEVESEQTARELAVSSEASARQSADEALDGRLDAIEAIQHRKHKVIMSSTDVSNGYIELPMEAISGSESVFVGPLFVYEGDEYSVSVVGGKTRITFMGALASGGDTPVASGDVIYVRYMK